MEFIKKVQVDEATFIEYNFMLFRKKNLFVWILVGVFIALGYIYINGSEQLVLTITLGVLLGALFVVLSYVFAKQRITKQTKLVYQKEVKDLNLVYTINKQGVTQAHQQEVFQFPWKKIIAFKETDKGLYLFYTKLNALTISKSALTNEELTTIHTIIQSNFPAKKS